MYVTIRQLFVYPHLVEEMIEITAREFLPLISQEPGFIDFTVIRTAEDQAVSISTFATKEQGEEGNRKALDWARERMFPMAKAPAVILGNGEVLLTQKASE
jgi:heme-degrading monooxygenase HmoA